MVSNPTKIPADTNILTRTFHAYGINMRYLGKVAANIESMDFPAPFFNVIFFKMCTYFLYFLGVIKGRNDFKERQKNPAQLNI